MTNLERDRRRLLLSTVAWVAGITAVATTRRANAFQTQEMPASSKLGIAFSQRCGTQSQHATLIAKLQSMLAQDSSRQSMTATCPICGCPVTVSR
jgi:hypothetical protein